MTLTEMAALRHAVERAALEARAAGERDVMRTQTDFIGRMNDCFGEIVSLYDGDTETFLPGDDRDEAIESLTSLAGLCIGLVAMLRTPEPAST